ncbi:hypothetical protein TraAM80_00503 [Trypanosoma rangeli]|uniref:Uncharacterized protein n=1 Tax=Trypanosoma rangeli TaxID=5698 RepID=A0A422P2Y2_TRYRA|nr:uncharacterized protein TraAM80_00503 [Trypanosoma rangeli]RNF12086.1 hypothetical protein TraAM80_00503 [Trypanosoma rangeli]|eukprot:RNF12086.1 hypothetical protein TraAM80_00503 [Trypanosoma rangeli]
MNTQPGDAAAVVVPQPSKRVARYLGEMVKLLWIMDRTPSSNWASLSSMLSQLLKCIESNIEAAAEVLPDPVLLCRVIWKCFEPKGVMGVHRKALDVLQHLCYCMGTALLIRQMPLLLVGVLELLPQCSIQLKCELLHFVEVYMLRRLSPVAVAVELPGLLSGVLSGLEEGDTSDVYRFTLQIMGTIHTMLNNLAAVGPVISTECGESEGNHHEQGTLLESRVEGNGDRLVYAALWLTLKNCPSLRGCVLLYMKLRLCGEPPHTHVGNRSSLALECEDGAAEGQKNSIVAASVTTSVILSGDPRITHSAIFATLQEPSERKHRLMLDVLIGALPLNEQTTFTFSERSLLVAAVIQLLGLPDVTVSIRRRIAAWLTGPIPEEASIYVQDVTSFLVAQAFHGVVCWWESSFVPVAARGTRTHASQVNPLEASYYQVLFTSACKHCLSLLDPSTSAKTRNDLTEACVMPTVWLRAFMSLFQHVFASDGVGDGDDDDNNLGNNNPNNIGFCYGGDAGHASHAKGCDDGADGSAKATGNLFVDYVMPLVMPFVCDLLVFIGLRRREGPCQSSAIDSTLSALFAMVTWDYFTRYEHDLVAVLEQGLEGLREVLTGSQANLSVAETARNSPSPDTHAKVLLDLQICFQRLSGLTAVVEPHVLGLVDSDLNRTTAFLQGVFTTTQSLCSIVCGACETLEHGTTGDDTAHFTIAQSLINGCLDSFNFIFFGMFSALQDRVELTGKYGVLREKEVALLDAIMRSSTAVSQLILRGSDVYAETLARLNDTAFSLFRRLLQSSSKTLSFDNAFGAYTEALKSWMYSVVSVASCTCPTVQQHAFQLYVDLLNLVTAPQALRGVICMQELTLKLLPRLWELLGTCGTGAQPQVVELLVRLYAMQEGRVILDDLTSVATTENGERLLLLFCLLDEEHISGSLFLPGFFMMLQALDHKDASLRWLAQSIVRQSLPCFYRVLNPLFDRLARYFTFQGTTEEGEVAEPVDCAPSHPNSHIWQRQDMHCLNPMEFLRLVKAILTIPSFLSMLLNQLHQMPPPEGSRALMAAVLPRSSEAGSDESGEVDMPLDSSFAALGCLLLGLMQRSLSPQSGGTVGDNPHLNVELCTEACETLNLMLEGTLSLPDSSETIVRTWHYTSVHMVEFLREVVRRPSFSMVQVLMLRHFLETVRFLNALDPIVTNFLCESYGGMLAKEASQVGASATVADRVERGSSRNCILALKIQKFYDAAAAGVEQAAARALTPGWAACDLLSLWCSTLLDLLPFFHEQGDKALVHLLKVFLNVLDQLLVQTTSPKESTALRVTEKCLNGIYGILNFCLVADKQVRQCHAAGKHNPVSWFAAHIPFLGGGDGSPSPVQKAVGSGAVLIGAVRHSVRPVLSTLCKLHCGMHRSHSRGTAGEEPRRYGAYDCVLASHADNVIHRVLRLYAQEVEAEFYKAYIEVWAAVHAPPLKELFTSSKAASLVSTRRQLLQDTSIHTAQMPSFMVPSGDTTLFSSSSPSDSEMIVQLLNTGAGATALSLIRVLEELLIRQRPTTTNAFAASSRHHALGVEMPFDAAVFYFLHTFLYVCRVPPGDAQDVLNALVGVATLHLSQGSPSMVCLPLIIHVLAHFVLDQSLMGLPASFSSCGDDEAGRVEWGRDKRCSQIICKVLDAVAAVALHTASAQAELVFVFELLALSLPAFACSALSDQDRVANAVLNLYKRSLLPSIMFGIESQMDVEVRARTPLVKAALSVLQVIVKLGDAMLRRLRQELLDTLFTCDIFHFPQSVIHEWSVIFACLSQDRTFHGDAIQLLMPSSSYSSRIAALIHSAEEEERQRERQTKRLVFYVTCVPPASLMLDREFCLLIREYIADSLRALHSMLSENTTSKLGSGYRSVRHSLFLFRVLLTKLDPALLHPFWPIVLPGVLRVLSLPSPTSGAAAVKARTRDRELLALQMECLKLLDFLVVIMPGTFAPFRWVFFDDLDATATILSSNTTETFVPILHRLAPRPLLRAISLHNVWAPAVSSSDVFAAWRGYQWPLLRFPPACYSKMPGIGACAGTLSLFSHSVGFATAGGTHQQFLSIVSTRLIDGWDEAYVRALVEADFSYVLEENTFIPSSC